MIYDTRAVGRARVHPPESRVPPKERRKETYEIL